MFLRSTLSTTEHQARSTLQQQQFLFAGSEPIARYFGRVYQYVGDEVVVTWPLKKGLKFAVCVRCFFAIQKQIRRYEKQYEKRYGRIPEFKAALHGGNIVVSEVGKYKSGIRKNPLSQKCF